MQQAGLEVIAGVMFAGKTEELIRRLRRAVIGRQKVQVFKPAIDNRFEAAGITSHGGYTLSATTVADVAAMGNELHADTQVVGIDEGQFFGAALPRWCADLAAAGRRIIVACLDLDYLGRPFPNVPELLALADEVQKLHAICVGCGANARRSYRLPGREGGQVLIGGAETYEPLCLACYARRPPL